MIPLDIINFNISAFGSRSTGSLEVTSWPLKKKAHMMNLLFIVSSSVVLVTLVLSTQASVKDDRCHSLTSCGECIRDPGCAWCISHTNVTIQNDQPHCQSLSQNDACPADKLVDPVPEFTQTINKPFSKTISLRPQRASLSSLRLGKPFNFSLQFKSQENYPADLYYLMDVSLSMRDDKNSLVELSRSLVEAMRNITDNFRIGFGSFVDKNVSPFVDAFIDGCPADRECTTYSFKHKLSLTTDVDEFTKAVNSTKIVQTLDLPEGGFDALLQVIVCKNEIGWRDIARRLIVFATDNYSHLAGNGRLGGIIKPNDGKCHLENQSYQAALTQDYPSLGQISRMAKENDMSLIFAVTGNSIKSSYEEFSKLISGSSVENLEEDSSNIVELIRDTFNEIASSVEITDTAGAGFKVRYYTACTGNVVKETNKCDGLKGGDDVNFEISIEVTDCPIDKAIGKQVIEFKPIGLNETMILELEVICDCPCEKPGNPDYITNATECNNGGDLSCGLCNCDSLHTGTSCECSADISSLDESQCRGNNTIDELCSNRGECVCGNCVCNQRPNPLEVISGKYCECDNFRCSYGDGLLCSGHGECKCGECVCNSGWQGLACGCPTSTDECIPQGSDQVCSGNGFCECGECICLSSAHGSYCQDCPTCPNKCEEIQPCVECQVFETGPYHLNGSCDYECNDSIIVEETVIVGASEKYCSYLNGSNCEVSFVYGYDDVTGERYVRVNQNPVCPEPAPLLAIGLGLLAAIVLAGLLALVSYRLWTYVIDKREYARFLNEKNNSKWNRETNPLYHDPTMTYRNPFYNS